MSISKKVERTIADRLAVEIWRHELQAEVAIKVARADVHREAVESMEALVESMASDLAGEKGFVKSRFLRRVDKMRDFLREKFRLEALLADAEAVIENGQEILDKSRSEELALAITKAKIRREQLKQEIGDLESRTL